MPKKKGDDSKTRPQVGTFEGLVDSAVRTLSGVSTGDLGTDLMIDKHDLQEEMAHQPSIYAWWCVQAEEAKALCAGRQLDLKVYEAELDEKIRKEAERDERKVTEAQIGREIKLDTGWISISEEVIELQRQAGVLESAKWSLAQRAEMLRSMAPGAFYESRLASTKFPEDDDKRPAPSGERSPRRTPV